MPSDRPRSARRALLHLAGRALRVPPRADRSARALKILLIRPDHIGDVLLTAPAVALLRASLPTAEIGYLVGPWSAEAARGGPSLDWYATLPFPGFTRRPNRHLLAPYALLWRTAARLRRHAFDAAVVFRPDHWWGALLAQAAGIPIRVGARTPDTAPLLSHMREPPPHEHAAEQALHLARMALEALGCPAHEPDARPAFSVTEPARAFAAGFWQTHALDQHTVIGLQPAAGAALKSWPVERWTELARRLGQLDLRVLLLGGPQDGPTLAAIRARLALTQSAGAGEPVVLFGQTLAQSAAVYERLAILVAPDGGPAHLAGAVGTPTVRLYGPAPARVFGPWPHPPAANQRVLVSDTLACVPCGHLEDPPCGARALPACMLAIQPETVVANVEQILAWRLRQRR